MPYGATTTVECYQVGELVNNDRYWDYVGYGPIGFVSDYWLYAGNTITLQVPKCGFVTGVGEEPGGLPIYGTVTSSSVSNQNGTLPDGGFARAVICYVTGPSVYGDDYWDGIYSSAGAGFVSDDWFYTGAAINDQLQHC